MGEQETATAFEAEQRLSDRELLEETVRQAEERPSHVLPFLHRHRVRLQALERACCSVETAERARRQWCGRSWARWGATIAPAGSRLATYLDGTMVGELVLRNTCGSSGPGGQPGPGDIATLVERLRDILEHSPSTGLKGRGWCDGDRVTPQGITDRFNTMGCKNREGKQITIHSVNRRLTSDRRGIEKVDDAGVGKDGRTGCRRYRWGDVANLYPDPGARTT